jgi:hypothetical protein
MNLSDRFANLQRAAYRRILQIFNACSELVCFELVVTALLTFSFLCTKLLLRLFKFIA